MKVSIFGLGYVGCVSSACLARDGHEVVGVDLMHSKVERLACGKPTVIETGLDDLLAESHRQGRLTATTDGRAAVLETDASIICVGTPTGSDGSLDLRAVKATARLIGLAMQEKSSRHVVILRSTVPAGTAESVVLPTLHPDHPADGLGDCALLVVPEFLREGSAIADYYAPPFVVVGNSTGFPDQNESVVQQLFGGVTDRVQWIPFGQAEMLKALCNVFHALKVAFANEVGTLCSALSIDGHKLMEQFVQDRKLNISPAYLRPGLSFGGSCLPKDLRMIVRLADREGLDLPLLGSVLPSNDAHLRRAFDTIHKAGHRCVGINGLSFKPGTDDLRESPIVLVAEHLIGKGYEVKIHDHAIQTTRITGANREYIEQHVPHLASRLVNNERELIEHSETLVLVRDGEALLEQAAALGKSPTVVDLRGKTSAPAPRYPVNITTLPCSQPDMAAVAAYGNG